MEFLAKQPRLVPDTETTGVRLYHGDHLIGVTVAAPKANRKHSFYFPFRHRPGNNLSPQHRNKLVSLLSKKPKTFWNKKFDTGFLMKEGMKENAADEDMMLLLHLLNENEWKTGGSYELKASAERYIDKRARKAEIAITNLLADRGLTKGDMQELTPTETDEYASDDGFYTARFREVLMPRAAEWDMTGLFDEVNHYCTTTRWLEERGILVDVPLTKKFISECEVNMERLRKVMARMAKRTDFNPGSHQQVKYWLGIPSSAATYIDEIEWQLEGWQRKAILVLQEWRTWQRAAAAYYRPMLANMDAQHMCHPNILLHGTISGRPSSRGSPNWFAIPRQTDDRFNVYHIKDACMARPGYVYINADYGQAELRLGAHYSGDEFNIRCFNEGKSPHKLLHAQLTDYGVDISYDDTKRVSFGVQYGTGAKTLSKELKKPFAFAAKVLKEANRLHPNYRPMLEQTEKLARDLGYIRLWTGRVRHFESLDQPDWWYHKACSNLIQGGIGEVIRVAITRMGKPLREKYDTHMLLQVYDSILFEVPEKALTEVARFINREMVRDFPFRVPMVAELKAGKRWGNVKDFKF